MIAGTDLFLSLFNNLAVFIVLVAVYGFLNSHFGKTSIYRRQIALGVAFGVFAIICMYVKIPVEEGVIVDQRNTVVALSGAFGGVLSAIVCAIMAGIYRMYLGGAGVLGGTIGVCLAAIAGVYLHWIRKRTPSIGKALLATGVATVIILPGFLFIKDFMFGLNLMKAMALPYGSAIFLGIFFVGVLLTHEENRHNSEVEHKKSEKRFRSLFESLIDVSYQTDNNGRILIISPSAKKIFGYEPAELIGQKVSDLYRYPSRRDDFLERLSRDGTIENFSVEVKKKDGAIIWVSTNAKLVRDVTGEVIGVEGVTRDISRLKKAEEEKELLEESLRQRQKMEAIGRLAGGIAHDFNNILTGIIGYTDAAHSDAPQGSRLAMRLDHILAASERAKNLVGQILSFSRQGPEKKEPLFIAPIVEEVHCLLRASLPATIEIQCIVQKDTAPVFADATKIYEVIMNVCTNAAYAMGEKGCLEITYEERVLTESISGRMGVIAPGAYSVIQVKDSGCGMTHDVLDHIFEPFYTTKAVGEGTGMGLAVVFGIVHNHTGNIIVESTPHKGTQVRVYLPKTDKKMADVALTDAYIPGGTERIYYIDDEEMLTELMSDVLDELGYQVRVFNDSNRALDAFRTDPAACDLVIADQTMPLMTGIELAQEMLRIRNTVPIILCTGYSKMLDEETALREGVRGVFAKPFCRKDIACKIRSVLDTREP